ncbi:unnamed protein product [marine sediment metagenome]|uniref:Uncharacterized protein n=1 Tax=marine sediment metagenome TaxID=412755 RepID=X0T4H9_9ZZZZ
MTDKRVFKIGEELTFEIYKTKVKGTFVEKAGNLILIKTTRDDVIQTNVGELQSIYIDYLVK